MSRHSPATRITLFAALAAAATGCASNDLPNYYSLGDLRVLAIVADQPEANPGTSVNLTPVISDLNGGGRTLSYAVTACLDPGIGEGNSPSCATPDPGNSTSGSVTPPSNNQTWTGSATSTVPITLPSAATAFAGRSTADQFNGVAYLVFYTLSVPGGGTSVTSMKRVIVSTKTPQNQNPTITSVNSNGSPMTSPLTTSASPVNFSVTLPSSAAEPYLVQQADGSQVSETEDLVTSWFVTDGSMDFDRTDTQGEDQWTPPSSKPTTRGMAVIAVTRDGRGGVATQLIQLQ